MDFSGPEFNVVDLVVLFIVLVSAIAGIRQGFLGGFLDLFGIAAGVFLAFKGYRLGGDLVIGLFPLPRGIANLAAFIGVYFLTQILFSLVFGWLLRGVKSVLRLFPLFHIADAFFGMLPGLAKGIVAATLLILPFGLFPIIPDLKEPIVSSYFGSRLISVASEAAPRLESLAGQTAEDTLAFLSLPQDGESRKLNFPAPANPEVDAGSEQKMLELVNVERGKAGLLPLVMDQKLRLAARGHSQEMFELSYFAHESPSGSDPVERMRTEGAGFSTAAENIAFAPNVEMAHSGLMNSPGHRENILTPGFKRVGIGVIDGGLRGKMFTQNFTD